MSELIKILTGINTRIEQTLVERGELSFGRGQFTTLARSVYDQQTGRPVLINATGDPDHPRARLVCESSAYDLQLCHKLTGVEVTQARPFGSYYTHEGDTDVTLLVSVSDTLIPSLLPVVWQSLEATKHVRIQQAGYDSYSIFTQMWGWVLNAEKNVDPALRSFYVRFNIRGLFINDSSMLL